jgi:mRNA interferase HigB
MQVIARRTIREYSNRHAAGRKWLRNWLKVAEKSSWRSLADVRKVYATADQFARCLIFDKGNDFRLVVRVTYATDDRKGRLFIKRLLTHSEYDKDEWKECCQ